MDIQPIIDRLKNGLAGMRKVGGAADLAAVQAGKIPAPSVFVLPATERAAGAQSTVHIQRKHATFSVVLAVSNKSSAQGDAAVRDLEPLRKQVETLLLGWAPDGFDPFDFTAGHLVSFDDQVLIWMDDFQTAYFVRSMQ